MPTYYDLPLLKKPVWTWEVPAYFFVGGAAGAAAVVGVAAQLGGGQDKLVRDARWIAAIGAAVSGPLLVSDLGRPERFLNMLRVFKPQSPMSVGAWTLAVFSGASAAAVLVPNRTLRNVAAAVSAATGAVMCTYTGVLIGATAIPEWKKNVKLLPVLFGASALGSAVSLLELRGNRSAALNSLGIGAAAFETVAPEAKTAKKMISRVAGALSGPIPFLLRLLGARKLAAASTLAGSLATRIAWIEAGKASASDIGVALDPERA
jgi:formate-dependent nitrite reductase membrane component NrfD